MYKTSVNSSGSDSLTPVEGGGIIILGVGKQKKMNLPMIDQQKKNICIVIIISLCKFTLYRAPFKPAFTFLSNL